jgi:hypothetical protein
MIWLFASVVLLLIVFHAGFRKFALWFGGIASAVAAVGLAVGWWKESHPNRPSADAYLDALSCTYGPKLPNGDCPAAPRFNVATSRPVSLDGRCPAGQQLGTTGGTTCYDPNNAMQLAEHLKECAPLKPGDPYYPATVDADKFGIACDTSAGRLVPPEDLPRTPEFTCPPGVPSTPGRCFQPASPSASK